MKDHVKLLRAIAMTVLLAWPAAGIAQVERPTVGTLFGQRSIGLAINPGQRTYAGGVMTNPGGSFVGVGRSGLGIRPKNTQPTSAAGSSLNYLPPPSFQVSSLQGASQPTDAASAKVAVQTTVSTNEVATTPSDILAPESTTQAGPPEALDLDETTSAIAAPSPQIRYDAGRLRSAGTVSTAHLASLIQRNPHIRCRSIITVAVRDGITILSGRVAAERDRRVAEVLAHLEPGVGRVKNELTVDASGGKD